MALGGEGRAEGSGHLVQRAYVLLNRLGGSATEAELIEYLFGACGNQPAWSALLCSVLGSSPLFISAGTGHWALASSYTVAGPMGDYVVMHIEATGLRAARQRVVDLALAQFSGGRLCGAYASPINPERRLPQFLSKATGITGELCSEAPLFAQIAGQVVEFIGADPIVAHDVELQVGFLNYELKRAGVRPVLNPRIDIMELAVRRIEDLGKPSLERIAQRLGIQFPRYRRAHELVQVASQIYGELAESGEALPRSSTPSQMRGMFGTVARRPGWLDTLPESPGAYVMRDGKGEVLYVGKGKNLRERVASYYSVATSQNRQLEGLLTSVGSVEVISADSEDEALQLESQLIREYRPSYNTQFDRHDRRPVIRIDLNSSFPRLELCREVGADGAAYFGPFPSGNAASQLRDCLNSSLGLPTCRRKFEKRRPKPLDPCTRFGAGECVGPCVARVSAEEYRSLVTEVVDFLQGSRSRLLERLWQTTRDAKGKNDYACAAHLQESIAFLEAVELRVAGLE